jgi:hypothetical protein
MTRDRNAMDTDDYFAQAVKQTHEHGHEEYEIEAQPDYDEEREGKDVP